MAICGQKTEVFSRVCGYHRPVKNWNKGKQAEFEERKTYTAPSLASLSSMSPKSTSPSSSCQPPGEPHDA